MWVWFELPDAIGRQLPELFGLLAGDKGAVVTKEHFVIAVPKRGDGFFRSV